jgi:cobalt-precorrin 5A hydrolase / precorrin-3B C17-methyltransferase
LSHPAIIVIAPDELPLARRIAIATSGAVHGLAPRVCGGSETFKDVRSHLQRLFRDGTPIIAIMASGAVIRLLAPLLADKHSEPPVVCVAADGSTVVPLLGGHHGANELARNIAQAIGAFPAVTTAGDVKFAIALDEPPAGYLLANPDDAKSVMAALNAGAKARIEGDAPWLATSALPLSQAGEVLLRVGEAPGETGPRTLHYHPRTLALGMGCERGADPAEAIALAAEVLAQNGLSPHSLAAIASIELKADEPALHAVAAHFGVPCRFFTATELEREAPRLLNPSEIVFAETGCHGVAEGAALALAGGEAVLVVPKTRSKRVTASIARAPQPVSGLAGRERGTLFVVGIGPGSEGWRSPEVTRMIAQASDLVGYSLYLDLVSAISEGKVRHDFDLGREEDRVRHAMELAGQGKSVALVCSGDAGIYAMATLVFELIEKGGLSDAARRITIEVSPGISALQAAAARAGAPLGHDFCTISLSDLLTPWPDIVRRVRAAAEGDFVVAFYNPVSKRRRTQLAHAKEVLLQHRPADTPVILAANLGREGETVRVVPLSQLNVEDVDMLTVVLVGSSQTRAVRTGDGRLWVYTPRGYAAKEGTGIAPSTTGERAAE